jgi:membrane protease YdiL (CAAX protease family)
MPTLRSQIDVIPCRRRWWYYTLLLGGFLVTRGISGMLLDKQHWIDHAHPIARLLNGSAYELILVGVVFGLAFYLSRVSADDLLLRWRGSVRPLWMGVCYSLGLRLVISLFLIVAFIVLAVSGAMDMSQLSDLAAAQKSGVNRVFSLKALHTSPLYFWISVTFTCFVVAGLREELWRAAFICGLKALWPRRFSGRGGQVAAVGVAALVFGFAHASQGPLGIVYTTVLGLGLGLIMVYHRSIWPAVIAHGLFDATTLIILRLRH